MCLVVNVQPEIQCAEQSQRSRSARSPSKGLLPRQTLSWHLGAHPPALLTFTTGSLHRNNMVYTEHHVEIPSWEPGILAHVR